jgi:hypothetical protein
MLTQKRTTSILNIAAATPPFLPFLVPFVALRRASRASSGQKKQESSKKKARTTYARQDIDPAQKFSLCDAMR